MIKYMQILAYLITLLARKANSKIKYGYLGDSIGWGFVLVNFWVSTIFFELLVESFHPNFIEKLSYGKVLNPVVIGIAILMILEYFIFFSRDQWREFVPEIEQMDRQKRRKLCWRVIWFLIIAVPLSIVLLILKNPMLVTWTG